MILAYADQNFLSSCAENPVWRDAVVHARNSGTVALVLSPLHFLEIGKADKAIRESILKLVDDVRPHWTYLHASAQLRECLVAWDQFCRHKTTPFVPICTLREAAAAMHDVHPMQLPKAELRNWVESFASDLSETDPLTEVKRAMEEQEKAAASNQGDYKKGRMTTEMLRRVDRTHIAVQLVRRAVGNIDRRVVYARVMQVLEHPQMKGQIDFFIAHNGMAALKCYQVESALTNNIWEGKAKLGPSRVIDRQHASIGLPYCERFLTDDIDLIKRCAVVKDSVKFPTAVVQTGKVFIESL